jgi:hypothetical protein
VILLVGWLELIQFAGAEAGVPGTTTTVVPEPVFPVAPVVPSLPWLPVAPVPPVLPVLPVAPVGPAGPGTATGVVGLTTTAGRSQALNANAAAITKMGVMGFMLNPLKK